MEHDENLTRREMLAKSGRTAAGLGLGWALGSEFLQGAVRPAYAQSSARAIGANERIVIALIGAGGMGRGNMDGMMNHALVDVAAVCDVDSRHMAEAAQMVERKSGRRPAEHKDFRRVLEMKDVDAVIIATPDHWHALPTIYACEAGKDIFLEKPISHSIWEGRQMVNAARKYNRVVQVNTWQRSTQHFIDAIDYVRSGRLGNVSIVRSWKTDNARVGNQQPSTPPAELDYDMWVGPAENIPYRENRCHYNWRWYWNYAAGMTGDWGVHMLDIALLGMSKDDFDLPMPQRIAAYGGKYSSPTDDRTTPDTHVALFQYPGWVLQWETHNGDYGMDGGGDHGTEFIGTEGRVMVDRGGWRVFDRQGKEKDKVGSERKVDDHMQDFLDNMRSRGKPRAEIGSLHQTTTLCHLANLAFLAGEEIAWDARKEVVTSNKSAMNLLPYRRTYRKPWSLPTVKV